MMKVYLIIANYNRGLTDPFVVNAVSFRRRMSDAKAFQQVRLEMNAARAQYPEPDWTILVIATHLHQTRVDALFDDSETVIYSGPITEMSQQLQDLQPKSK
jgi:hypothetical protein